MSDELTKIFDFIMEVDKLKSVLRMIKPIGLKRYENSAEHSWQVCLLAQLLASQAKVPINVGRVIELLLVHDIPEIDIGDQIVYQSQNPLKAKKRFDAARRIFGLLPEEQAAWCMESWQEYEHRETNESVFANAIDHLMPVLYNLKGNGLSWRENKMTVEKTLSFHAPIGDACPAVWQYLKQLVSQSYEPIMLAQ